jgi:hypothetical protein
MALTFCNVISGVGVEPERRDDAIEFSPVRLNAARSASLCRGASRAVLRNSPNRCRRTPILFENRRIEEHLPIKRDRGRGCRSASTPSGGRQQVSSDIEIQGSHDTQDDAQAKQNSSEPASQELLHRIGVERGAMCFEQRQSVSFGLLDRPAGPFPQPDEAQDADRPRAWLTALSGALWLRMDRQGVPEFQTSEVARIGTAGGIGEDNQSHQP